MKQQKTNNAITNVIEPKIEDNNTKVLFTVSQLCDLTQTLPQYLYKILQRPIEGVPFSKENVNYGELHKYLLRKYETPEKVCEILHINNIEDIEITKNAKITNSNIRKITLDKLVVGSKYILRSYHHEIEVKLQSIIEINDDTAYIFELTKSSKNTQDKYRILTAVELSADRFTIKDAE